MTINELSKARSEITHLQSFEHRLIAFSTRLHGLKFFSLEEYKVILNYTNENLDSNTTALAFSNDSKHIAFSNGVFIYVINLQNRELVRKISTNNEEIDILSFDLTSLYVIAGTKSGRVLQYKYSETSLLSRICSFVSKKKTPKPTDRKSFVSAIAFHKNKIASSGYGGSIIVVDLHSLSTKDIISPDTTRKNALCFRDNNTIISGTVDGTIHINSISDKTFHKQISAPFRRIKQIILMPNPEYIMISGDSNTLSIIDIKRCKIAKSTYLEFEDKVGKIVLIDDNTLVVSLKNMKILEVEIPNTRKLQSLLLHNSLDEAFEVIDSNPMLKDSNEYAELEEKFDKIYLEAVEALINQNQKLALQLTDMFKNIPSKRDKVRLLFEAFKHYPRFQTHCSEQKLSLAYAMANKFPALEHTWQYVRMEEAWKNAFKSAQKQVLQGSFENAKMYLSAYATVLVKKDLIKLILKNNSDFIKFLKAIDNKNFSIVEELANKHLIFKEIPTYDLLNEEINYHLNKAQMYLNKGNVKIAKKYLDKIKDVPSVKEQFIFLNEKRENIIRINELYKQNDFISCYEMIDNYKYLADTEFGLLLEKHWSKIIHKCENYALSGNIKGIKSTLGELLLLSTRRDKIGDLLRVSFHTRIKILMAKKTFKHAETIIYSYLDIFGFDKEIDAIMKLYEIKSSSKLAIADTQNNKPQRDAWINSDIILRNHS